jgi:hypothetical protein
MEAQSMTKSRSRYPNEGEILLRLHRRHMGLYKRVALRLDVDSSYVSRVAMGTRRSERIMQALIADLSAIHKAAD